jgi:pimeloyl-ACP methyl ester carboxylesterase
MHAPANPRLARMSSPLLEPCTVVMLHGTGNSGAMWRRVSDALPIGCVAVTPDLIGYGAGAAWPAGAAAFSMVDEVRAIIPALPANCHHFHLLGYSYGGAVALAWALAEPRRVLSLTLIEPVFPLALAYRDEHPAYAEFGRLGNAFVALTRSGRRDDALRLFVDFWTGDGAWDGMPEAARATMLGYADKIVLDWTAAFANDPGAERLATLAMPVALLCGDRSPEPMRRLVEALSVLLPGSMRTVVPGANHMLPFTHAAAVIGAMKLQVGA